MKKLTKENKLQYMGAALSLGAFLIALYALVVMLKNGYSLVEIVLTFAGLGTFGYLTAFFYNRA